MIAEKHIRKLNNLRNHIDRKHRRKGARFADLSCRRNVDLHLRRDLIQVKQAQKIDQVIRRGEGEQEPVKSWSSPAGQRQYLRGCLAGIRKHVADRFHFMHTPSRIASVKKRR